MTELPRSSPRTAAKSDEDDGSGVCRSMFCPKRYPDFVAPEYRWFQTWDTIQQMTKLVNHHFGELAWFAFHGVGDPHASVSRAVLFTLSRQLFGHKVSVLGTTPTAGLWFAAYVKTFRTLGGTLEALATMTEIFAFQINSILLLWAAGMLGAMAEAMNSATRSCILQHFSKEKNNHDVTLKENNQDNAGSTIGVLGGLIVVASINRAGGFNDQTLTGCCIVCFCLCMVHVWTNLASSLVLKIPPGTFFLRHCKTRRYVIVTSGNSLAAAADTLADERVEIFKLPSDQIFGKALMSTNEVWFDQDGQAAADPCAAQLDEDGQSIVLRGEKYQLEACTSLRSSKSASTLFFPPGWPVTMPKGFDAFAAYDLIGGITSTPRKLLHVFIYWKYVAGVGDASKGPAYACLLGLFGTSIGLVSGLISGVPILAENYDHRWLIPSYILTMIAEASNMIAMVFPLKWYLLINALGIPLASLSNIIRKAVYAEVDRRWASHPSVELIHLNLCKRNRATILNLLTSILCVWYSLHLVNSSIHPSLQGIFAVYVMLLLFDFAANFQKSKIASELLQNQNSYDYELTEMDHEPYQPQRRLGEQHGPGLSFSMKKFGMTLFLVMGEAAVYAGLVTTLSGNTNQLEPCTERCLQFKLISDQSSIPGTGMFPFPVRNGLDHQQLKDTCQDFGGLNCELLTASCSASVCEERRVRRMVEDRLSGSKSKTSFVVSIGVYSVLNLMHDVGLQARCLGPNDAVMLQILATLCLAVMAASALMWASGAMELFFSPVPVDSCGCYFRMADVPSIVALVLPLNLVIRLQGNVKQAMYAAIIESSCLRTVVFALPYHFIRNSKIHSEESLSQGSLLGVEGLGRGTGSSEPMPRLFDRFTRRESVKHWAQWLPFLAVGIVILPLLLSSSFIIYRVVDLVLSWLEASLSKFVTIDRSCGTIALFGVYSMILMQTLLVGYFLSGLHTLYFVLSMQLGKWPADPQLLARLTEAKPELRWALRLARRATTR